MNIQRRAIIVTGQVQGVGFRPFVYRLALTHGLSGQVGNTPEGVCIEVQGAPHALAAFEADFSVFLPPLARISGLKFAELIPVAEEREFRIVLSRNGEHKGHGVLVSPDMAVCDKCLADMFDPANRRFGYAFTNCTDCGPRFSITRSIPYDRPVTSMSCFPLCPECSREYGDPLDRRFHAQPNACAACGPALWLETAGLRPGAGDRGTGGGYTPPSSCPHGKDALRALLAELRRGGIAAIKGLGGFHLACDALNEEAVKRLRARKNRPHKALAVMVADLEHAERFALLTPAARAALTSPERPIVVCPRRPGILPAILAPDSADIGLALPYTPLHHLLFHPEVLGGMPGTPPAVLVMTSGNAGGEPISLGNREARERLGEIADVFLLHNRDILVRVDDSVLMPGDPQAAPPVPAIMLRRARGYVPSRLRLPVPERAPSVLAAGAELKHTFCLTRGNEAFVSQHIGQLSQAGSLAFFRESLAHLSSLLEVAPAAVVRDLHPDYLSSRLAEEYAAEHGLPVLTLQHHKAHIYAVLAEHGVGEPSLGLALDGSGLGEDGTVWGGELLLAVPGVPDRDKRLGRLRPFPLPGGEAAIRSPWRIAEALWELAGLPPHAPRPWGKDPKRAAMGPMLREMAAHSVNSPLTSSCGRLFDAVAALCGLGFDISYEGQAAILLEEAQDHSDPGAYEVSALAGEGGLWELDSHALFRQAGLDRLAGVSAGGIARRFHRGLVLGLADWAARAAELTGISRVVLAGGVMNNRTLAAGLPERLRAAGLTPLLAKDYPPGDGAISLGQAAWACQLQG